MRTLAAMLVVMALSPSGAWAADAVANKGMVDPGFGPAVHDDDSLDEQVAFVNERIMDDDTAVAVAEAATDNAVTDASFNALPALYQVAGLPDEE
ncbi:hypothetical protein [Azospirillum sp. sgz302134]